MNKDLADGFSGCLVALMFAIGFWAISVLPKDAWIAVHWSADWQPDGWTGKWVGMLFMPALATFLCCAQSAFTETAPAAGRVALTDSARRAILVGVLLLQAAVQAGIALKAVH